MLEALDRHGPAVAKPDVTAACGYPAHIMKSLWSRSGVSYCEQLQVKADSPQHDAHVQPQDACGAAHGWIERHLVIIQLDVHLVHLSNLPKRLAEPIEPDESHTEPWYRDNCSYVFRARR